MATAPLWELSLLRAHYHPHLAAASHSLVTSGQSAHVLGGAHAPEEAAEAYDTTEGRFRPPPQPPKVGAKASAIDKVRVISVLLLLTLLTENVVGGCGDSMACV